MKAKKGTAKYKKTAQHGLRGQAKHRARRKPGKKGNARPQDPGPGPHG